MSIPMSVGQWLWNTHGIDLNDLSDEDVTKWQETYNKVPFALHFDGSGYRVINGRPTITLSRGGWIKEYRTYEAQQERRAYYEILPHTKTGDLIDYGSGNGCRWCDLHGCLHGEMYVCKHYSGELQAELTSKKEVT